MSKLFSEIPRLQGERIVLKRLTLSDADALRELTEDEAVYRYLPTFLYEKQYEDTRRVISGLYEECIKTSLILGVFYEDEFCGLAEIYCYRAALKKVSVGCRLIQRYWGKGVASQALNLLVKYLLEETNVEIITASSMVENRASANVLRKNGFKHVAHGVREDWGYTHPTLTDKWLRTGAGYRLQYRFHE